MRSITSVIAREGLPPRPSPATGAGVGTDGVPSPPAIPCMAKDTPGGDGLRKSEEAIGYPTHSSTMKFSGLRAGPFPEVLARPSMLGGASLARTAGRAPAYAPRPSTPPARWALLVPGALPLSPPSGRSSAEEELAPRWLPPGDPPCTLQASPPCVIVLSLRRIGESGRWKCSRASPCPAKRTRSHA